MYIHELFDDVVPANWKHQGSKILGTFILRGDTYQIDLNINEMILSSGVKRFIDVAFRKNESSELTHDNIPFKVLGSVLVGVNEKLQELKPDFITFSALAKDGNVDGRISLYNKLSFIMSKKSEYEQFTDWIDIKVGKMSYMIRRGSGISKEDCKEIRDYITHIADKAK